MLLSRSQVPFLLSLGFILFLENSLVISLARSQTKDLSKTTPIKSSAVIAKSKEAHKIKGNSATILDTVKAGSSSLNRQSMVHLLPPDKLAKDYTDALKQILNLNALQYDKIIQVNRVLIDKIDALIYSSKDYGTFKQGLTVANKERLDHYKEILSPAQLKSYTQDSTLTGLVKVMTKTPVSEGPPVMRASKN